MSMSFSFPIYSPAGNSTLNYGLVPDAPPQIVQVLHGKVNDEVLQAEEIQVLAALIPAAIAAGLNSGSGEAVKDAKGVFKNIKAKMDHAAVRALQNQMVELCKRMGWVIVLEGEEGPGRDKSAGALPGTIFYSGGMILPSHYEEEFDGVPEDTEDILDILEWKGVSRSDVQKIVYVKIDSIENTTNATLGEKGAWTLGSFRIVSPSSEAIPHYTPDFYVGGWSYSAPKSVDIMPYESPSSVVPKLAEAWGETVEEYLSKTTFVVLDRRRHESMIDELKEMGANVVAIRDGDAPARILSVMGEINGRRIVVLGASGANEAASALNAALIFPEGNVSFIHTTHDAHLLGEDVQGWYESGCPFSEDELQEFARLHVPMEHYQHGSRIASQKVVTTEDEVRVVALAALTGAREEIFGELASSLPGIEVIPDGKGGARIILNILVGIGGGDISPTAFVLRISYHTDNLERSKALLTHMGLQAPVYEEPPR